MRRPQWLPSRADAPGIALAAAIGGASTAIVRALPSSPYLSVILVALVLGALVLNTPLRRLVGLELPGIEREPDRYAAGLRFTGKWVLRLAIILMGLKVQSEFFGGRELVLIAAVAAAAIPSAFFVAHALASALGIRRPLADLLAVGTMICGASAVNAVAPIARARREEQGIAIGVIFLFSIVALVAFRPIAAAVGLDPRLAGIWSGLAVNDLSSAVAVGLQMGEGGDVMATAAKSARILTLAPLLVALALLRRDGAPLRLRKSIVDALPMFILGYLALAVLRFVGDQVAADAPAWRAILAVDRHAVDLLLATVAAGIGLHLGLRALLASGAQALAVGGGTSVWIASLTLGMIVAADRGGLQSAALVGAIGLGLGLVLFRRATARAAQLRLLRRRFDAGAPLSLGEATRLLDAAEGESEAEGGLGDPLLRRILTQLHPTIGELIPVRESPLGHGVGCRWITYWEGRSGWALVAVARDPGSTTPIHAHPHRLLGKAIEGVLEEIRFTEREGGELEVASRAVLGHNELVETDGRASLHIVRAIGRGAAIDLQLRGPEDGLPGRRFVPDHAIDVDALAIGQRIAVREEVDDRPGQAGEGASAGRVPSA
ncbi:MAG: putative sulfate exporter family transporter [Nannocystaceae bacterium]